MQKSTGTMIDSLLEVLNISQLEFANKLDVTSGAVTNWKKRKLGINVINKIVKSYPQVSREWLMTGKGQPLMANRIVDELFSKEENKKAKDIIFNQQGKEKQGIPLIPTSAMAGVLSGESVTINEWEIEDRYLVPVFKKSDFCIRVEGKSMEPRYQTGDIIACTNVPLTDIWFQWGKVYVVNTRQGVLVKHVEQGADKEHIKLISDNPEYKPFEIPTTEIFGVAIVNGLIRIE